MIDARTQALIDAALDDELGTDEARELENRLSASPEARAHYDSLLRVHGMLRDLPAEAPPRALRAQILNAAASRPTARPVAATGRDWPAAARYGIAAGLGLAAGLSLLTLMPLVGDTDPSDLQGTLAPAPDRAQVDIRSELFTSAVSLARGGDFERLIAEIDATAPVELVIDLTGTGLRFAGLAPSPEPRGALSVDRDVIRLRGEGRRRYELFLARQPGAVPGSRAAVRLEYVHDGTSIERRTLPAE